jgi:hypothetical protein
VEKRCKKEFASGCPRDDMGEAGGYEPRGIRDKNLIDRTELTAQEKQDSLAFLRTL